MKLISAQFGISGAADPSPDRLFTIKLGGGSLMDIGGYCVQFIIMVYGAEMPETIKASGILCNGRMVEWLSSPRLSWPTYLPRTMFSGTRKRLG